MNMVSKKLLYSASALVLALQVSSPSYGMCCCGADAAGDGPRAAARRQQEEQARQAAGQQQQQQQQGPAAATPRGDLPSGVTPLADAYGGLFHGLRTGSIGGQPNHSPDRALARHIVTTQPGGLTEQQWAELGSDREARVIARIVTVADVAQVRENIATYGGVFRALKTGSGGGAPNEALPADLARHIVISQGGLTAEQWRDLSSATQAELVAGIVAAAGY